MSGWNTLKSILGVALPATASALFTPAAGAAISGLCGILGLSPDSKPEDIEKAYKQASPEQLVQLKIKEIENEQVLANIDMQDRDSARKMAVGLSQNGEYDWTPRALSFACLAAFVLLGVLFLYYKNDAEDVTILKEMITTMGTLLTFVFGYYYGSSHK